jgi:hypothetical protein
MTLVENELKDEIKELRQEVEALKKQVEVQSRFERWLKVTATIGAAVIFVVGFAQWWYTSRSEFRQKFWEAQWVLYQTASHAAAEIATGRSLDDGAAARTTFWNLYWGKLSIVESQVVKDAMVDYGKELSRVQDDPKVFPGMLRELSYKLARACRQSLAATWEPVPVDDVIETKSPSQ